MPLKNPSEVLGYQLRIPISRVPALWSPARREQYLLYPMTGAPLSADLRVWPLADNPVLAERLFEDFSPNPCEGPNGLNVFRLRQSLNSEFESLCHANESLVAIGTSPPVAKILIAKHFIVDSEYGQPPAAERHEMLGYDVCDQWLLSGLMNCGVGVEKLRLRKSYAGLCNVHGLFDDYDAADRFAIEIAAIVPEHAPFFAVSVAKVF